MRLTGVAELVYRDRRTPHRLLFELAFMSCSDSLGRPLARLTSSLGPNHARRTPGHFLAKRVTDAGTFRFQHRLVYIANALVDQWIGLEETDDGV
jgi:hypothetical protein